MKIGDFEVPDSQLEDVLKKAGKRVVDNDDYIKKSEAAADLAKFRAVTGDSRSVDEIGAIIKRFEDEEKKNKTQAELLSQEVTRLNQELKKAAEAYSKTQRELRIRDVDRFFEQAQEALGVKVIDSIMHEFRTPFYDIDEAKSSAEEVKVRVNEAIAKAVEKQNSELARLGLGNSTAPPTGGPTFGGQYVKTPGGGQITAEGAWDMLKKTSSSPMGLPFSTPQPNK